MDGDGDAGVEPVSYGGPSLDESQVVVEADEALLSRLALIGDRPLADRAAAFRQLHDELRSDLETTDVQSPDGNPTRTA